MLISYTNKYLRLVIDGITDWDNQGTKKKVLKETSNYKKFKNAVMLINTERSSAFNTYINNIMDNSPTLAQLQIAIRASFVIPGECGCVKHSDFLVAEKLLTHL